MLTQELTPALYQTWRSAWAAHRDRLRPNGLIVVSAVTLESFGTLLSWAPDHRASLCRIDIANECPLAKRSHHFAPQNTIYVFTFHKEAIS